MSRRHGFITQADLDEAKALFSSGHNPSIGRFITQRDIDEARAPYNEGRNNNEDSWCCGWLSWRSGGGSGWQSEVENGERRGLGIELQTRGERRASTDWKGKGKEMDSGGEEYDPSWLQEADMQGDARDIV
jgi:hypothetical protein